MGAPPRRKGLRRMRPELARPPLQPFAVIERVADLR